MKIIDLLNKIANEEEVPNKIKLKNFEEIYTLREDCTGYKWYGEEKTNNDFGETIHENLEYILKQDIEIIEEPKKIEKIEMYQDEEGHYFLNKQDKKVYVNCDEMDFMVDKFNELIDEINNLKEND